VESGDCGTFANGANNLLIIKPIPRHIRMQLPCHGVYLKWAAIKTNTPEWSVEMVWESVGSSGDGWYGWQKSGYIFTNIYIIIIKLWCSIVYKCCIFLNLVFIDFASAIFDCAKVLEGVGVVSF